MARLVRHLHTNNHAGHSAGDIFECVEDDAPLENDAGYMVIWDILDIPGISVRRASRVKDAQYRAATIADQAWNAPDEEDRVVLVARHRWNLNSADLTGPELAAQQSGRLIIPPGLDRINALVKDKAGERMFLLGN